MQILQRYLPILSWARSYNRDDLTDDVTASIIVTIMLIPQSLAYALLAGLPPEAGIYASIAPIILYAIFGTSRALAVGPVAVVSLMTAAAIGQIAQSGTMGYVTAALSLAFLSGGFLLLLGLFRLGFLANFLSHPVVAGFITASGILIAISQVKHILGVSASGHNLPEMLESLYAEIGATNLLSLGIGLFAMLFLFWARRSLNGFLLGRGVRPRLADILTKAGPVFAVVATTLTTFVFRLDEHGVKIVGAVPQSLPPLTVPSFDMETLRLLLVPAILISVIGFVESISVAQTLAAKKRQRVDPNQELIGLGMANIGAAFTGGYPVTGGFSRSVVNYDAGAQTPAAGAYTAIGLAFASLFLTPLVYYLPNATLAATIIIAVLSLIDFSILGKSWRYSKADFAAVAATIIFTLMLGVEIGVLSGVALSIALYLFKTSRPHVAEVGLVAGTEHFRNVDRHQVKTDATLLTLRVDESLYFANARFLEDLIQDRVVDDCPIQNVVLMCSAVNDVDYSALESLEAINSRLKGMNVGFHLSEVKGPVMDRIAKTHFLEELNGRVFLSEYAAYEALRKS